MFGLIRIRPGISPYVYGALTRNSSSPYAVYSVYGGSNGDGDGDGGGLAQHASVANVSVVCEGAQGVGGFTPRATTDGN